MGMNFAWSEIDSNWVPLFNGKDLTNWYAYIAAPGVAQKRYENPADDPDKCYKIVNGEIVYKADTTKSQTVGYLGTDLDYSRYHFRVEYKIGPNCAKGLDYCKNSGIMYHMAKDGIFGIGIESNMYWNWPTAIAPLGNVTFVNVRKDFGNFGTEAATMGVYAPVGEWNTMEIKVWGDSATEHYVNGHLGGWGQGIKKPDGTPLTKGRVALQIEGNDISFRNPMIRDIDKPVTVRVMGQKAEADFFSIQGNRLNIVGQGSYEITVIDPTGRKVFSRTVDKPGIHELRTLVPTGLYILNIRSRSIGKRQLIAARKILL